ncbi:Fibroblast growth factor like protein, partial [Habropoda laboriosa]
IFQRTSVSRGQLRIQGVATCLYLCMDSCGLLYGSREYTDDCVFNETLEQHNYNTYTSVKWSTTKKSLYLGLNGRGQPRRVQARGHNLGRLSAYVRVLTQVAPLERVEALQRRMLGAQHNVRHRHNNHRGDMIQQSLCPTLPVQEKDGRDKFRCRKRKKRKKRKRRCRPGERPGPQCQMAEENGSTVVLGRNESLASNGTSPESKRSCEGAASEEACRREALSVPSKKRKLRVEEPAEAQSVTVKVPDTVSDRSVRDSSPSSVELSDITEEDTSKLLSESLSNDEDPSSTFSNEHATATINSMFGSSSIETGAASTMLRLFEEENKSVEEIDDADDSDRFDIPETIQSTTPGILLERLAM